MTYLYLIPVLNEIENISELTNRIALSMKLIGEYQILFIDDGSTDGTIDWIRQEIANEKPILLLSREKMQSGCMRGKALYDGLKWALQNTTTKILIEMDGDLSHRPEEAERGVNAIRGGAEVVIASKYLFDSRIIGRPFFRNLMSWCNSLLMRMGIQYNITDYSNGYRFYTRRAAEVLMQYRIKQQSPIYLSEVLCIWMKNNLRIVEVASTYSDRAAGNTKVVFGDIWKGLKGAVQIIYWYRIKGFERC